MISRTTIPRRPAIVYIMEVLSAGNTLAHDLAEACDVESGTLSVFLPSKFNISAITNYAHGAGLSREESLSQVTQVVKRFLDETDRGVCLCENRYEKRGDPGLGECRSRILFYNDEVYHVLEGDQLTEDVIKLTMVEADTSMSLIVVCSSGVEQPLPSNQHDISDRVVQMILTNINHVIVEAFDGEGFLIWSDLSLK